MVANGSFDLKKPGAENKHAIEFGIEYEQRIDRNWGVRPIALWDLGRQLANTHLTELDLANPYYIIEGDTIFHADYTGDPNDGPIFGQNDSIFYFALNSGSQNYFDRNLRNALGMDPDGIDQINVLGLSPEDMSLEHFSADELMREGNRLAFYSGYDYLGNKLNKQPAYEDFFNDSINRPIGAFRPVYTAFYIQDKFAFKDLIFNIGVRIDRFDANQKVLKDKRSLYPVRTASEVDRDHPSTIGSDFVVYVDDFSLPESEVGIVGYRDDDTWYDAEGSEVANPSGLIAGSNTTVIPYLVETDLTKLDLDINSFKDYEPKLSVAPRIAFSFPISDEALFFAHYDVLTQRPQSGTGSANLIKSDPYWYFYFNELRIDRVFPNPDLKPGQPILYH